jgi:hypothetical protein
VADYDGIRQGLATLLHTRTGLRAHADAPGAISPPCVVVIPGRPAISYGETMDGEVNLNLLAIVLLSAANETYGQQHLDSYLASHGSKSINAAVNSDPTLGGTCEFAVTVGCQQYGLVDYAGQQYIGATFLLQAGAHG